MKTTTNIAAISGLLSVILAHPDYHNHQARHHHPEKREIVWDTVYEVITETVAITTTIVVDPEASTTASGTSIAAPSSSDSPGIFVVSSSSISSVFVAPTPSVSQPVATFSSPSSIAVAPIPSTSIHLEVPTPSTSIPVEVPTPSIAVPKPSSVYVPPVLATTFSSVYVPPTPSITVYVPPTTSTPVYVPPTTTTPIPSTTSSAPVPTSLSTSGTCSSSSPCTGDLTYYTTGEGACGWTNDGLSEHVVALSHIMMGTASNDGSGSTNSYCGKIITIKYGSSTTTAKVVDKCMGCAEYAIDLSTLAFSDLLDLGAGRVTGDWWFSD